MPTNATNGGNNLPVPIAPPLDARMVSRQEFSATEVRSQSETAMAAVAARERAIVEAEYVMAERHPRVWMDVRAEMLAHCRRPRFAEVARYAKPVGKEKDPETGEWVEKKVRGFSARFAETLAQEMGNLKPLSAVTYEDDMLRIVRIGVTDLQKNLVRAREVTFTKTVEKRGKKRRNTNPPEFDPPEGREVLGQRLNSYGEPVFTVRATEDEMRSKVNSEESKTQRDFILKFVPRDILEDCEDAIKAALEAEDKRDPLATLKRLLDRFREFGVQASDLEQYIGRESTKFTAEDIQELRELGSAIRDGQTTFDEALQLRHGSGTGGGTGEGGDPEENEAARALRERLEKARRKQPSSPLPTQPTATAEPTHSAPPSQPGAGQENSKPASPERKTYTTDTLPDTFDFRPGTDAYLIDGNTRKLIQVIEEPGEASNWKLVSQEPWPPQEGAGTTPQETTKQQAGGKANSSPKGSGKPGRMF